ncbi:MAG: hypothetical protein R2873_05255 [Caldilineaceae bacterium]
MPHPISTASAEHYAWGDGCDGWHLLRADDLSVIEERVPPGKAEVRHLHRKANSVFHIPSRRGYARDWRRGTHRPGGGQGIDVPPGAPHQLRNDGAEDLHFLVISAPKSHGDREIGD